MEKPFPQILSPKEGAQKPLSEFVLNQSIGVAHLHHSLFNQRGVDLACEKHTKAAFARKNAPPLGSMYIYLHLYLWYKHQLNVGKYTIPMDPCRYTSWFNSSRHILNSMDP